MSRISERAAKIMKTVHLARHPMMDLVAIKLNNDPTGDELQEAREWEAAFAIAATDIDLSVENMSREWSAKASSSVERSGVS